MSGALLAAVIIWAVGAYFLTRSEGARSDRSGRASARRERAQARNESRGHRGWLSGPADAAFAGWGNFFDFLRHKHEIRHGDRKDRWQKRRAKRAATKTARAAARDLPNGRHAKGATPDTPSATGPNTPPATPKSGVPGSATPKPATPVAPTQPVAPSIPLTGGPTMATTANVPPSGEVNSVAAAKRRAEEWDEFFKPLMAYLEQMQASWTQQEKALLGGVVSAERTAACLLANGATDDNPAVVAIRAARERINQMATYSGEVVSTLTSLTQAGRSVRNQLDVMQAEIDIWMSAKQQLNASMPGVTPFMTQGG